MKKDALLVLSGGLDSVVMLYDYKDQIGLAVTYDYGSNNSKEEIKYAAEHCKRLGIEHIVIPLPFIHNYFNSSLLQGGKNVPICKYNDPAMKSIVVPFRNGIMLAIACGLAESMGLSQVLIATYFGEHCICPDCSTYFVNAMAQAMFNGTDTHVRLLAPYKSKAEIVKRGNTLGVDFNLTYSCYVGGGKAVWQV